MGMDTSVVGLRDPHSKEHQKMVSAATALHEIGIHELPDKLQDYFTGLCETGEVVGDETAGCQTDISEAIDESHERSGCDDWTVDLGALPKGVTHIRFTNSY